MPKTPRHYLDYAASAPLRPEVLDAMLPWLCGPYGDGYGNANSLYREGKAARQALDEARLVLAQAIGATPPEVVFTSGGTESNNALIAGLSAAWRERGGHARQTGRVISSAIEHHAVLEPLKHLKRDGLKVELLRADRQGFVQPEALAAALAAAGAVAGTGALAAAGSGTGAAAWPGAGHSVALVSIMAANNEVGSLQDLSALAALAHGQGALFHSDAVQILGKLPFDVQQLNIDAASFSAHKLGGPKGVGAFYLRTGTPFSPQALGGGQEMGRRSGTQNVAGAVGFARALALSLAEQQAQAKRLSDLRDRLAGELLALDAGIELTVDPRAAGFTAETAAASQGVAQGTSQSATPSASPATARGANQAATPNTAPAAAQAPGHQPSYLPNLLSLLIAGHESESLIMALDKAGVAVSSGSACSTGSLDPSHVLTALGVPRRAAEGALRISLGYASTSADIDALVAALKQILRR